MNRRLITQTAAPPILVAGLIVDTALLSRVTQAIQQQSRTEQIQALKDYCTYHQNQATQYLSRTTAPHGRSYSGLTLSAYLSQCYDQLLTGVLAALQQVENTASLCPMPLTLVALGGYGRQELYPQSDLDIMMLVDKTNRLPAGQQRVFEQLLYLLWDGGCKVGHAVHGVATATKLAREDMVFATSLLDMRLICGSQTLFGKLQDKRNNLITNTRGFARCFVQAKHAELLQRHRVHADHKQQLEPDLKEGIGALRDIQHIRWLSQIMQMMLPQSTDDPALTLLLPYSQKILHRAHICLSSWRFALHTIPEGHNNRLQFYQQPSLAQIFAYRQQDALTPMMRLMKHFFSCRYDVECLVAMLTAHLSERGWLEQSWSWKKLFPRWNKAEETSVGLSGKIADVAAAEQAEKAEEGNMPTFPQNFHRAPQNPQEVLGVFMTLSEYPDYVLSAQAWQWILQYRGRTSRLRRNAEAYRQIRALLCQSSSNDKTLYWLNRAGILSRIMPEFAHICGLGQWDGYHAFSVDNHTLKVLHHLYALSESTGDDAVNSKAEMADVLAVLDRIGKVDCLYIAAFLHDIAKGMGGEHAQKGAIIARDIAPLMGFDDEETGLISWLVEQHLLLSSMALRRDILDPNTVDQLLMYIRNAQQLDLLYVLTVADIQGVSAHSLTAWKATVLSRLYSIARPLIHYTPTMHDRMQRKRLAAERLYEKLRHVWQDKFCEEAFNQHINNCTGDYLVSTDLALQVIHAQMLISHPPLRPRESLIQFYPQPDQAIVQLVIYTTNYTGLTSHTMGTLSQMDYSIATMKVFPYADHNALLTVWFHQHGRSIVESRRLENVRQRLEDTINKRFVDIKQGTLLRSGRRNKTHQGQYLKIPTRIRVDNQASRQATVIEIQAHNRPHLLFDLCVSLMQCHVTIQAAKVDTFGQRALDVFYIRNRFGLKILDENHLSSIKQALIEAIEQHK